MAEGNVELQAAGMDRDLEKAQTAYAAGDAEASKAAHMKKVDAGASGDDAKSNSAVEKHGGDSAEFIKSIVFGGLDGVMSIFAVITAAAGAGQSVNLALVMGFGNLIGDGISMGLGDFLSERAEMQYTIQETKREEWEYDTYKEGEIKEMVDLYVQKGMSQVDAESTMNAFAKYKSIFVNLMVLEELGLKPVNEDDNPMWNGVVTFCSFISFGFIPLFFYVVFFIAGIHDANITFPVTCFSAVCALFALGVVQSSFTNQGERWSYEWFQHGSIAGAAMGFNGSMAGVASYLISWGAHAVFGSGDGC